MSTEIEWEEPPDSLLMEWVEPRNIGQPGAERTRWTLSGHEQFWKDEVSDFDLASMARRDIDAEVDSLERLRERELALIASDVPYDWEDGETGFVAPRRPVAEWDELDWRSELGHWAPRFAAAEVSLRNKVRPVAVEMDAADIDDLAAVVAGTWGVATPDPEPEDVADPSPFARRSYASLFTGAVR